MSNTDKKHLSILGSTGSIGQNTLRVVAAQPGKFEVLYLSAGKNADLLIEQALQLRPRAVAIADASQYPRVREALQSVSIEVLAGNDGILDIAQRADADLVVNAIVGAPGLEPTYTALQAGKDIALSNKESLVMAGEIIMNLARRKHLNIFPIDSEHSAIWQCLAGEELSSVKRLILTGSGGPFRSKPVEEFESIRPEDALKHPTWSMGRKITIDSATLMNKGLEVIEARWLFDILPEKIDIVIHPQSIIHSMVEFVDGSIKAQLGLPDMKLPIQYALNYPRRPAISWESTDFSKIPVLNFEEPDSLKFPALRLAYEALKTGGTAPAILNVINELAVYAFLERKIRFIRIAEIVEAALSDLKLVRNPGIEDIFDVQNLCKDYFREYTHSN